MKYSVDKLRKFLFEHLDHLTPLHWIQICENYHIDLDILREFRDYIEWAVVSNGYNVFGCMDDKLNGLREFRHEINWKEDLYKKWVDELEINVRNSKNET